MCRRTDLDIVFVIFLSSFIAATDFSFDKGVPTVMYAVRGLHVVGRGQPLCMHNTQIPLTSYVQ